MYLPLLPLLRLLRPLSPSDRDIDAARPGQSIGCGVEFSSFEPTTFRGKFHMYANAVSQELQLGPLSVRASLSVFPASDRLYGPISSVPEN